MRNFNKLALAIPLGLSVALGTTACSGNFRDGFGFTQKGPSQESTPEELLPELGMKGNPIELGNGITKVYEDGTAITRVPSLATHVVSFCDGTDLVDVSYSRGAGGGDYGRGGGITRTADARACADGKLTPEDFALPAETTE